MSRKSDESSHRGVSSTSAGWQALGDGRWELARREFTASLASQETPESLEGLSWAAWWLDDVDTVFESRKQAFRLYRTRGDVASAARMATWLASDHLDFRGALAVACGWLGRARRLLDSLPPQPDHGWLYFHEGYIAFLRGDVLRSRQLARHAAELGRHFEVPDLAMLGLALDGAVLVAGCEVEEGMRCLDEATAAALESDVSIPISRAWACCFLVSACEAVRDYQRAFEWCDRIAEFVDRYGSVYMLGFCRQHYGAVHVWRGEWSQAAAALESGIEAQTRSRPALAAGPLVALAELRQRQGRPEEAEGLLERAGAGAGLECRARLALEHGDSRRAVELAQRALRRTSERTVLNRVPALEVLVLALSSRGDTDRARLALSELHDVARRVGTPPLRAAADLAEGILLFASGDYEQARRRLEDAVDAFEQCGAPFEAARARLQLAGTLAALLRTEDATREATVSLATLTALGARTEARRARELLSGLAAQGDTAGADTSKPSLRQVTRREREVLRYVAHGLTNREIAARLIVSEHTIHRHITNILRKLNLPTRTAAAAYAARAGLTDSSPI